MSEAEILADLGGIMCRCSPEKNHHMPMPLGPAGYCPNCGTEGPFYQQALRHYQVTHNGVNPHDEKSSSFKRMTLTDMLSKGVPPPTLLCDGFLYAGGLHSIAGAPDSGKTTIALHWANQLLRTGHKVLFLDEEGGPEIVTEKLMALGARSVDMDGLTYLPFPGCTWTDADIAKLTELAKETSPAMMLWDSSAAFLARAGLDENSASDTTSWWNRVLTPIARDLSIAMVVIDHDTKASEQSRYARGSGAKLAAIDVQFKVDMAKPFTRTDDGVLRLLITKDRRGYLHRTWRVHVKTGNGFIHPDFSHDEIIETGDAKNSDWPPARKKIYEALGDIPKTGQEIVDAIVDKHGHGLKRETVSRELNQLLKDGYVDRIDRGHGREASWTRISVGGV